MSWLVVLMPTDFAFGKGQLQVFGPYATAERAEEGRRRVHFYAQQDEAPHQKFSGRTARAYVIRGPDDDEPGGEKWADWRCATCGHHPPCQCPGNPFGTPPAGPREG